jgi:tetratricopeptide (TPR) repeat protein
VLLARKVRSFWGAYEIPDSLDYYLVREHAPVLRLPIPGFGLLAPLALTGIALTLRRRGWPRLLIVFVAAYAASIVAFFVFSRFRMVIAPALYVFAAHAAVELVGRGRGFVRDRAAWRPALAGTGLFLVFLVFVNLPVRARTDTWGYRLASSLALPVRAQTSALGHYNLGLALARRAKLDEQQADVLLNEAEQRMRTALELQGDVGHGRVQVELGKVLARQQRNREAIEQYREAARLEPNDYRIWHSLGLLHSRENDLDAAAAAFREALRIAPGHAASATRLGTALLGAGRREEAAQAFRHALRISPDSREAREGLQASGFTN